MPLIGAPGRSRTSTLPGFGCGFFRPALFSDLSVTAPQNIAENCHPTAGSEVEAKVTVEGKESKAMANQIMTVSKERLTKGLGSLSPDQMHGVDMAMRIQLGLAA